MQLKSETLEAWLTVGARPELARIVGSSDLEIALPQARRLQSRLDQLRPASHTVRLGIVHTFTTHLLDPWLSFETSLQGLALETYHAPYGFVLQEAQPGSGLISHRPDITLLMLQREDLDPTLAHPLSRLSPDEQGETRARALGCVKNIVARFRAQVGGFILVTVLPALTEPSLGLYDMQSERSETGWWASFKTDLAGHLRDQVRASLFLDLDQGLDALGRAGFFDLRLWYSSRFPFAAQGAREVARRIATVAALVKHPKAKVLAVDADNTLWGGVIGEDGIDGIALGPDYPGNAYMAFQRRLLDLQQRGFILVLCSKNNPDDVAEVLERHPHQILRSHHFVAQRVNWDAKPRNLESLAAELNLGLDSFIFIDDSEYECSLVESELPAVEVIRAPKSPIELARCLDRVARLEVLSLTAEDREKAQMYAEERQRHELEAEFTTSGHDLQSYLRSLQMKMQVRIDDDSQVPRLAQLTQKTNQFNLTTRRYSEQRIQEYIDSPDFLVGCFSLTDIFGNSGVVGLVIIHREGGCRASLDTFLMSCRVIGRRAESAFLETIMRLLAAEGIDDVRAEFLPTAKNALAKDFLTQHGFERTSDHGYRRLFAVEPPRPAHEYPVDASVEKVGRSETVLPGRADAVERNLA
jgi:FkbH-like protein